MIYGKAIKPCGFKEVPEMPEEHKVKIGHDDWFVDIISLDTELTVTRYGQRRPEIPRGA